MSQKLLDSHFPCVCVAFVPDDDEDSDSTIKSALSMKDRRREAHTHAEQKRRDNIKVRNVSVVKTLAKHVLGESGDSNV